MDGLADPAGDMPAIQPTRRAAIGIGPAGLRMVIAGYIDGLLDTIAAAEAIAPLGHALVETGSLEPESLAVIEAGVAAMADEAICLGAAPPEVAISSAFSSAADLNALEDAIIRGGGRATRVLAPGDEANLTYVGAMAGDPRAPALVVSIGEFTTELMGGAANLHWVSSVPCGSLGITEQFLVGATADLDDLEDMIASARESFEPIAAEHPVTAVVGVGRLAATVAMLGGSPRIDLQALTDAAETLAGSDTDTIAEDLGVEFETVAQAFAGVAICEAIRRAFGVEFVWVTRQGLEEGLALDLLAS